MNTHWAASKPDRRVKRGTYLASNGLRVTRRDYVYTCQQPTKLSVAVPRKRRTVPSNQSAPVSKVSMYNVSTSTSTGARTRPVSTAIGNRTILAGRPLSSRAMDLRSPPDPASASLFNKPVHPNPANGGESHTAAAESFPWNQNNRFGRNPTADRRAALVIAPTGRSTLSCGE